MGKYAMLKLKSWGLVFAVVLALGGLFFFQSLASSTSIKANTIADIPMPKLEKPLRILTPANEIFEIASCSTKDVGFAIATAKIPPGAGPFPHVHYFINEFFWIPEGGIEFFHSQRQFPDPKKPPTIDGAGRAEVFSIATKPNQLIYSPHTYMHGFVNPTNKTLPILFIWFRDKMSPDFEYHDGGMREYFSAVGAHITDLNNLPEVTNAERSAFVTQSPKFGTNQSAFMMQYVSTISDKLPLKIAQLRNDRELKTVIKTVNAFNNGDKSVSCS
jgi:hypothetical protein